MIENASSKVLTPGKSRDVDHMQQNPHSLLSYHDADLQQEFCRSGMSIGKRGEYSAPQNGRNCSTIESREELLFWNYAIGLSLPIMRIWPIFGDAMIQ
jgi:hypothetical protein